MPKDFKKVIKEKKKIYFKNCEKLFWHWASYIKKRFNDPKTSDL